MDSALVEADEKIASFRENGWVYLPRLIAPALAVELSPHAHAVIGLVAVSTVWP